MNTVMTRCLLCVSICIMASISGCAHDRYAPYVRAHLEKPEWVSGGSSHYPSTLFITGHGVSASLEVAKRQSVDELTLNFNAQVDAYLKRRAKRQAEIKQQENNPPELNSHQTPDDEALVVPVDLRWDNVLQQKDIAEIWQDPSSKAYHVLAVIDRVKVGEGVMSNLYRLDEQVNRYMEKAEREPDVLQRIAFARMAINKQRQRKKYQTMADILKSGAAVPASRWSKAKVSARINAWFSHVKILPVAQQQDYDLLGALRSGLQDAGFIVDFGSKPDYILKASFAPGQIRWQDGVYSQEGHLQLELWDGQWKGQVRGNTNWPIAVTAIEREQLPGQIETAIKQANATKIKSALMDFENN